MRLIDADEMLYELSHWKDSNGWYHDNGTDVYHISEIKMVCGRMPTVDAVERKKGKWVEVKPVVSAVRYDRYECSECGKGVEWKRGMNFCPNCGADMRGEEE